MRGLDKKKYKKRDDAQEYYELQIINIDRICLRCNKNFSTYSKFIRLCNQCKTDNDWENGSLVYTTYRR